MIFQKTQPTLKCWTNSKRNIQMYAKQSSDCLLTGRADNNHSIWWTSVSNRLGPGISALIFIITTFLSEPLGIDFFEALFINISVFFTKNDF